MNFLRVGVAKGAALALTLGLLGACGTVNRVASPMGFLDSSETLGTPRAVSLAGQVSMAPQTSFTNNYKKQNPDAVNPDLGASLSQRVAATIRLGDSIDLEPRFPTFVQVKYQFLGDSKSTAEPGNISASALFGAGFILAIEDLVDQSAQYSLLGASANISLIAGYRVNKWLSFFGGVHGGYTPFAGDYKVDARNIPATEFRGSLITMGPQLGFEVAVDDFKFRAGGAGSEMRSGKSRRQVALFGAELAMTIAGVNATRPPLRFVAPAN